MVFPRGSSVGCGSGWNVAPQIVLNHNCELISAAALSLLGVKKLRLLSLAKLAQPLN